MPVNLNNSSASQKKRPLAQPSTFDKIEQLVRTFKNLKKKKKIRTRDLHEINAYIALIATRGNEHSFLATLLNRLEELYVGITRGWKELDDHLLREQDAAVGLLPKQIIATVSRQNWK